MSRDLAARSGSGSLLWWIVFRKELHELWIGGKALYLILLHTLLLGVYSFLLASNAEVNLLPLKEMLAEIVRASVTVGGFVCLIVGADSVSGERERATLEGLLLTPTSRRQLLLGKFLAASSPWPVALAISIPYWIVLAKGDPVIGPTVLAGAVVGTLIAFGLAGVGMLVSTWCAGNKSSMLMSLGIYILMLMQTQVTRAGITPTAREIVTAMALKWTNPWHGASEFLGRTIWFGESLGTTWSLLVLPAVFPALMLVLVLVVATRNLRLEPDLGRKLRSAWARRRSDAPARRPAAQTEGQPESTPQPAVSARPAVGWPRLRPVDRDAEASAPATWRVVCAKELKELWVGGKALNLTIAYALLLGVYTFSMARHSAVSVEPPKDMVFELLKSALLFAVFMGVIIGADSLAGERERGSLEGLLLTPMRRRQIVIGKFVAAISTWPAALLISVPYFYVLAQGDEVFGHAVLWGGLFGTVLILGFTAFGMLVSFWCNTNKSSFFLALGGYLLFLLPTTLTGHAQAGFMGRLVQGLNPMGGPRFFLAKVLVNNRAPAEVWPFAVSCVVFALLAMGVLFWYASPGLRLDAGRARKAVAVPSRAVTAALVCLLALFGGTRAWALQDPTALMGTPLRVSISMTDTIVRAGAPIEFDTEVTNEGMEGAPPLIVAMNIINLNAQGDVVDPEDWSPQRTQYVPQLAAGASATLSWRVNAILDGDFMVYIVAIPAPSAVDATSQPVATSGIHVTVTPYAKLNPGGVLPYVVGGPLVLGLIIFLVYRHRRRQIDVGGARGPE